MAKLVCMPERFGKTFFMFLLGAMKLYYETFPKAPRSARWCIMSLG